MVRNLRFVCYCICYSHLIICLLVLVFGFITALAKRVGGARGLGAAVIVMLCMNAAAACNVGGAIVVSCGRRRAFLHLVVRSRN